MDVQNELKATVSALIQSGRGILAADESEPTIAKRFKAVGLSSTEELRRAYRTLLLATPHIGRFISGVILFEETLSQRDDRGMPLPALTVAQGIVPGIKVDKGVTPLSGAPGDNVTQGLDGLADRLKHYKTLGARFAKWREVYPVSDHNPTALGIEVNAETLARYAAICQLVGIVPIVEPEVLLDGDHSMQRCAEVTEQVLHAVFHALHRHGVALELMLLKPSMVLPGKECPTRASVETVARETLQVLKRTVPAAVPSINFLSGGQTPEQATAHLDAMNRQYPQAPWSLSFSYARALQEPVMACWHGSPDKVAAAQQVFYRRAELNSLARQGKYDPKMENAGL
ncbi:MAG: fructose-bisphosphate aldolase class I [Betaproteobacteria bacterium]|nr:fructose-bisphosphate aldolase class I [Betaproteobacteria bacterium]